MKLANKMAFGTLTSFMPNTTRLQIYEYSQGYKVGLLFQGTAKDLFYRKDHLFDKLEHSEVARIEADNGVLIVGIKK